METQLTLTLSLAETNMVLEALGQLPFAQVYELIGAIQQQANDQLGLSAVEEPEDRSA